MKYFLVLALLFSSLFAHSETPSHLHFFSSWHMNDFLALIVSLIVGLSVIRYFKKEVN